MASPLTYEEWLKTRRRAKLRIVNPVVLLSPPEISVEMGQLLRHAVQSQYPFSEVSIEQWAKRLAAYVVNTND